ncbi:MAG: glycosyl transferase [Patescibacteria group bacterium]|nr:MAG: glycosyl transferase [Patescibacteria group bacterium]
MRLGIDARLAFQTGVGVHIRNMLYYLQNYTSTTWQVFVYSRSSEVDRLKKFITADNFRFIPADFNWHSFSEQSKFLIRLYQDNLNLMHFTYFSFPVLYKRNFLITLHDLIPYNFKTGKASTKNFIVYEIKYRMYKFLIKNAVTNSKHIFVPSKTVADEICDKFNISENKLSVIYGGVDKEFLDCLDNTNTVETKNYFLYVGNFYPHKNVDFLIKCFLKAKTNSKLVLVGPDDYFSASIESKYAEAILKGRLIFKHNLPVSELVYFYKQAKALIFPSLSEGFGLPVIEAFSAGLPVIASKIPVFEELYKDSLFYFDPRVDESLIKIIKTFDKIDTKQKTKKLKKGEKLLVRYNFANLANKVFKVYNNYL